MTDINALGITLNSNSFPHPVRSMELVETHISVVVLTGDYAYKLKKPVNFGFVDFSTLEKRKYYCEQELALNRRLAPDLYLDVVGFSPDGVRPIKHGPESDTDTTVIEYGVMMRQFDRRNEFDKLLESHRLDRDIVRRLAGVIAEFHNTAAVIDREKGYATPDVIRTHIEENFEHILAAHPPKETADLLSALKKWVDDFFSSDPDVFDKRLEDGFVRECHGDLHLANIVLLDDVPTPFDCIEFDPAYRCIDLISEIAFTIMDLDYRQRPDLARIFLDTWLQYTGDYAGLRLLHYYLVYRATVRAKVSVLNNRDEQLKSTKAHLELATRYTKNSGPKLIIITHGVSGCGKTHISSRLIEVMDVIRVRSDVERKRIFGTPQVDDHNGLAGIRMYSEDADELTYDRLQDLASEIVGAGYSVILDATYLLRRRRRDICKLAERIDVGFVILHIDAPVAVLKSRIKQRATIGTDASDATRAVLNHQLQVNEQLDEQEIECTVSVDSSLDWNPEVLMRRLETKARRSA